MSGTTTPWPSVGDGDPLVTVLVDTSALYALLDEDDVNHPKAAAVWPELVDTEVITTHAYVVVESTALVRGRLGVRAAHHLHKLLLPAVRVQVVEEITYARAVARWLQAARERLSLVDVTSFVIMEQEGISAAFAFDRDFARAGFSTIG